MAGGNRAEPDWVKNAVWWHVYPLGFVGAETEATGITRPIHRLGQLQDWLGYAVELGASGLMLGPIFAASTHGYDTIDHFRIDPRLGDDGDFDALIRAAHERGLRVILDGVFNHVGRDFGAFRQVLSEGPGSSKEPWFRLSWPTEARAGAEPDYATFEGHRSLVVLNHDAPAVASYVVDVMNHWLERGGDGWRLDAAYAVPTRFWATVLPCVRASHPQAYILGEVIHGDYAQVVSEGQLDATTQYELWKAIWSSLVDGNFFELAWALERHNRLLDDFVPLVFVGNHDVTRLATRLGDDRVLPHALAILLTCGGTPAIYAGDEQAFRGVKEDRAGGDDAIRPAFPASPRELAAEGWPIYRLHQQLIGLRRRNPWLRIARCRPVHLANEQMTYEARHDEQRLLVALNIADHPTGQPAPGARSVIAGQATLNHRQADTGVELPAHGWAILAT